MNHVNENMQTLKYKASSFSIIFKSEKFIKGLLENIIEQEDFENIEFIFLNPNSPDNSFSILEPYLWKHKNFKYIFLENDPGLYECWNICIKNASSDYVTNWNPDDRRTNDSIVSLIDILNKNTDYDLVYGLTYITKNENEKVTDYNSNSIWFSCEHNYQTLFFHNSPHCMPMWRKSIHEKYGFFDNSYVSAGDGDMWLRATIGGSKFFFLKKIVGSYYESNETFSRNKEKIDFLIKEVYEMRCKNLRRIMGLNQ